MKKIKFKKVKNFFSKIIKKVKDIWFQKITKPKLERKKRLDAINAEKTLHKNFELRFGVSSKKVKKLINKIDEEYHIRLKPTENSYLEAKLIEGKRFSSSKTIKAPLLYDVDTVSVHNELFVNNEGLTLDEVKIASRDESVKDIEKQEDKIRFNNLDEKTKKRIKSILRPR